MDGAYILKKLLEYSGLNGKSFSEKIGLLRPQAIYDIQSGKTQNISASMANKIISAFPEINRGWLQTGEGEMLKSNQGTSDKPTPDKMIPFYDAQAVAGNFYEMDMSAHTRPSKMIRMGDFLNDSEAAIQVFGNSMTPNYPAGCIIGTKLHTDSFIEPGTVYVIETRDNRYLKRLYYCEGEDCFECVSDNHMLSDEGSRKGKPCYPSFKIPFNEVVRLHRVTGVIKRNII